MKMNKVHFNLDTMVQNITLLQNTRLDNLSFPLCFMATSTGKEIEIASQQKRNALIGQKRWQDFRYCANRNGVDDWVEEYPISMLVVQFISSCNSDQEVEGLRQKSGDRELPCSGR